jgi:gas vesicle protein
VKGFLIGISAGATIMFLLAPKSGRETRRYIGRRIDRGRKAIERSAASVHHFQLDVREKGKKTLKRADKVLTAAAQAGRSVASALVP